MTCRINKLYKPAELVAAVEAVQKTGYASNDVAREIVVALHTLGFRVVYVGHIDDRTASR